MVIASATGAVDVAIYNLIFIVCVKLSDAFLFFVCLPVVAVREKSVSVLLETPGTNAPYSSSPLRLDLHIFSPFKNNAYELIFKNYPMLPIPNVCS
jgi:hypothetical protein